jgi:hypothetical protein
MSIAFCLRFVPSLPYVPTQFVFLFDRFPSIDILSEVGLGCRRALTYLGGEDQEQAIHFLCHVIPRSLNISSERKELFQSEHLRFL